MLVSQRGEINKHWISSWKLTSAGAVNGGRATEAYLKENPRKFSLLLNLRWLPLSPSPNS
jgi:hypothetical protein